jgi:ribose transport system permease protein
MKVKKLLSEKRLLLALILLLAFTSLYNTSFLSKVNLIGMLVQISFMTVLTIGMTFVILTGGIDLSVGAQAGLATVIVASVMKQWSGGFPILVTLLGVVLALAVTSAMGFLSGALITGLNLPPLIVTLSMTWIAQGVGNTIIKGQPIALAFNTLKDVLVFRIGTWIPVMLLIALALLALSAFVLSRLRFGREIYAVGSSRYAAYISGMKTRRILRRAYTLSGLCSGIAGLFIAANLNSGFPDAARDYELYSIAAVVMGGISLSGGEGRILNAFWGVILLRVLNKLVVFTGLSNISGFMEGIIIGAVLVAVLFANSLRKGDVRT